MKECTPIFAQGHIVHDMASDCMLKHWVRTAVPVCAMVHLLMGKPFADLVNVPDYKKCAVHSAGMNSHLHCGHLQLQGKTCLDLRSRSTLPAAAGP